MSATLVAPAAPAFAASASTTFVTMVSNREYVGQDIAQMFYPGNGTVRMDGNGRYVGVSASGGTEERGPFFFLFYAPENETLAIRTYENANGSARGANAGLSVSGDGRGCQEHGSTFTVRDIGYDAGGTVNRFWATYEQRCLNRMTPLSGEVRVNVPGGDSDMLVAGSKLQWPQTYPGTQGMTFPIWLANTGNSPWRVTSADITGDSGFAVRSNDCGNDVVRGTMCSIAIGFSPQRAGPHAATLTITDTTAARTHTVTLRGTGIDGTTSVILRSDPGDPIGVGRNYRYSPANAEMRLWDSSNWIDYEISGVEGQWTIGLQAPSGTTLTAGTYPVVARSDGLGPQMGVRGVGHGCSNVYGSFTITEIVYKNGTETITRLAATFDQYCEGTDAGLHGWVNWRASQPSLPDFDPPAQVTDLTARGHIGFAYVSWANPTDEDWTRTIVQVARGLPPTTPDESSVKYAGKRDNMIIEYVEPGETYSVSVWPQDRSGNYGPRSSLTIQGSSVLARSDKRNVPTGNQVTIDISVVDTQSAAPVPWARVVVYTRRHGDRSYTRAASLDADGYGKAQFRFTPSTSTDVLMQFGPHHQRFGSATGLTIWVSSKTSSVIDRTTAARNQTATIRGTVAPNFKGRIVYLQRYSNGAWRNEAQATLNSLSSFAFAVKQSTAGTFKYRVVKPSDADIDWSMGPTMTLNVK